MSITQLEADGQAEAERAEGHSTAGRIHAALAEAIGMMPDIDKDETNTEQHFKFRSIDRIASEARTVLSKVGVHVWPVVLGTEYQPIESRSGTRGFRCLATVAYHFAAADGSEVVVQMVGEANDYGDKATSKAVQMAWKYALTEVLMVGAGDRDPDASSVGAEAPTLTETEIAAKRTNQAKADLLSRLGGDTDRAKAVWAEATAAAEVPDDAPLPPADLDKVRLKMAELLAGGSDSGNPDLGEVVGEEEDPFAGIAERHGQESMEVADA